jgi:hypothetical protein
MDVFFTEGQSNNIIYKYGCNVGPLVNKFVICGNLIAKMAIAICYDNQETFLRTLENKTIYVSSAEVVHVEAAPKSYYTKEVLWFQK